MVKPGDLRKGNWVRTEYGIVQIAYVIWNDVYVFLKDGRTNYAREVEGVGIGEIPQKQIQNLDGINLKLALKHWLFIHELQNFTYWTTKKELKLEI